MGLKALIAHALGRGVRAVRPRPGQVVRPMDADRWRDYPADGLTPGRLVSILREADDGAIDRAMALYQQMEEKDAHLYSVARTRRLALTGLSWQVISAADVRETADRSAADEAADYCREALAGIEGFDEAMQHLSLALGRNIAVAENIWEYIDGQLRLVEMVPVDFGRLTFDGAGQVRVLTEEAPHDGIELPPYKFVVHTPHVVSGHPMRGGLLRATAVAYLGKHLAMKDWLVFAELFGMPVRIARYEPSATPEEKRELLKMLESLSSDAAGIFSKAVELQLLEAGHGKTPPPYERICEFFNREMTKAWLGATLTVDTSGAGLERAAGGPSIHNEVRLDLRQEDIACEARTIRRDVLTPLVRLRFGEAVPVPHFRRQLELPRDRRELSEVLGRAVNNLRMRVPARWAHETLGIPMAGEGEQVLTGTAEPR